MRARGKHLLIDFDDGRVLHTHLRMHGRWQLVREGEGWRRPAWAASVAMRLAGAGPREAVGFDLPVCELLAHEKRSKALRELGPDLLDPHFDLTAAVARLRGGGATSIGEALLDQSLVSGVGNVYKSEVLFLEGVDPFAPVSALSEATLAALLRRARTLLRRNAAGRGPRTTRRTDGRLWIYGRDRALCRVCGGAVRRVRQGERSTYLCPACQTLGRQAAPR